MSPSVHLRILCTVGGQRMLWVSISRRYPAGEYWQNTEALHTDTSPLPAPEEVRRSSTARRMAA